MSTPRRLIVALLALILVSACQPAAPLRTVSVGEEVAFIDFSRSSDFEQGVYDAASLLVRDGIFRIDVRQGDNELWWGQWGEPRADVAVDVDVQLLSERPENAFGVMCRVRGATGLPADTAGLTFATAEADFALEATEAAATAEAPVSGATEDATAEAAATEASAPDAGLNGAAEPLPEATDAQAGEGAAPAARPDSAGDGYLFLIQGSGSAGIFRSRGRALTALADWRTHEAIKVGPDRNHLRAMCVGDYLAFYVNDVLVADATDATYGTGQVGLAASAANRLGVRVEFDNLTIATARAGG